MPPEPYGTNQQKFSYVFNLVSVNSHNLLTLKKSWLSPQGTTAPTAFFLVIVLSLKLHVPLSKVTSSLPFPALSIFPIYQISPNQNINALFLHILEKHFFDNRSLSRLSHIFFFWPPSLSVIPFSLFSFEFIPVRYSSSSIHWKKLLPKSLMTFMLLNSVVNYQLSTYLTHQLHLYKLITFSSSKYFLYWVFRAHTILGFFLHLCFFLISIFFHPYVSVLLMLEFPRVQFLTYFYLLWLP